MNRVSYGKMAGYFVVAAILFCSGWLGRTAWERREYPPAPDRRVRLPGFHFTSPLLDVELPEGVVIGHEPIPFKHKVQSLVEEQVKNGRVRDVSVYYRDLHDGPWFGINEKATFNAASMMKVPVMIAWLKRAETDSQVLGQTLLYDGAMNMTAMQRVRPKQTLVPGRRYTVEELLTFMLRHSDNNATALLYYNMDGRELDAVLDGMDINNTPGAEGNSLTVHGYSGFFRILYNASFLSHDMSERALQLLSTQDFPQGIVAGVPEGVVVASKFGEFAPGTENGETQLHEFGIVYHPLHPYILGIMTRGKDFALQEAVLREISRLVYTEVDASAARPGHPSP